MMSKRNLFWRIHKHFFGKNFFSDGYLFLNPDVAEAKFDPYKHFVLYGQKEGRTAGWPAAGRFNANYYLAKYADVKEAGVDPWKHYVCHGKAEGRSCDIVVQKTQTPLPVASTSAHNVTNGSSSVEAKVLLPKRFNGELYLACNPDVKQANYDPEKHYIHMGYSEGRCGSTVDSIVKITGSIDNFNKNKKICVVVTHELSQTGCPINTWNMMRVLKKTHNVIAIALAGGDLEDSFRKNADLFMIIDPKIRFHDRALNICLREYLGEVEIEFAIINSLVSRSVLPYFALRRIPALHFIHEFAYYHNKEEFEYAFMNAGQVIFSAKIVLDAALSKIGSHFEVPIIPQGKSEIPWKQEKLSKEEKKKIKSIGIRKKKNSEFVFLAVGTVEYRKGVDLFIRTAGEIKQLMPDKKFRFLWAGRGWDNNSLTAKMYEAQIFQYGLQNELEFLGPIKDIDAVYEISDAMLMTSILDPLPGVVIESMSFRKPVLVFENCSGFPEHFKVYGCDHCIARYLDVNDMATKAVELVKNRKLYLQTAEKQHALEMSVFNMDDYINKIIALIPSIKNKMEQEYKNYCDFVPKGKIGDLSFLDHLRLQRKNCMRIGAESSVVSEDSKDSQVDILSPVIFGLKKKIEHPEAKTSEELFALTGGNTGNLAFHHAIDKALGGGVPVLPWCSSTIPVPGSIGIIPCANQLGAHCNMKPLADWMENLDLPFVGIGLGAQSSEKDSYNKFTIPQIPEGTKAWLQTLADHAPSDAPNISLRGEFSRRVMESLGLEEEAVVLGCPSLFINSDPQLGRRISSRLKEPERIALATGHHALPSTDALENSLSEIITASDGACVIAHDLNMIKVARGEVDELPGDMFNRIHDHFYKSLSDEDFRAWTKKRCKVFFDVPSWMDFYWQFDFVVGPRIHGIMLALQAGVPALCIAIDSRTQELCETMKVPYVMAHDIRFGITKKDLMKYFRFDPDEFDANRKMLAQRFIQFLESNKIKPDPYLYEIGGIHLIK